jgi:ferrous iron transport protein B
MGVAAVDVELPILAGSNAPAVAVAETIALVGNPNAGKTTLFNRLTGLRAQTANFPGTTVEHRRAAIRLGGHDHQLIDLPGIYSLEGVTLDELVTCRAIRGELPGQRAPDVVVLVLDATNLERSLFLASQVLDLGIPSIAAINLSDVAEKHGMAVKRLELAQRLGCEVVSISARSGAGMEHLQEAMARLATTRKPPVDLSRSSNCGSCAGCQYAARYDWAERVGAASVEGDRQAHGRLTEAIDRVLTHRAVGLALFAAVMLITFALIFWIAQFPMDWIDGLFGLAGSTVGRWLPAGDINSLVTDGVIGGVGGMLVFLPQICLLFFMLAILEDSGYLARAAFVMDRLMHRVGLPGKAFVPLLSAHACAIPAVMASRVIEDYRDRLATIMVIPLMTCSARIPVYAMVIALLFPHSPLTASLVFTGAYVLGIVAALGTAWLCKRTLLPGRTKPLVIELPNYRRPSLRNALLLTWDRATVFIRSVGTTILVISLVMWALATYPKTAWSDLSEVQRAEITTLTQQGQTDRADRLHAQIQLENSFAGRLGRGIQPVFAPLGFDWKMSVGVISSFAAREVVVSTLAVLYGVEDGGAQSAEAASDEAGDEAQASPDSLIDRLRDSRTADGAMAFTTATCLSLLVFYTLAMQCLPTQAVVRRETGSWRWPLVQLGYMSLLAYVAALVTYQTTAAILS